MELGALCPDYNELGVPSYLPISFSADKCHIFFLSVHCNILLQLKDYAGCKGGSL